MRVMTYNLRGLRLGVRGVAAVIETERPDVVLVQESGPGRSFRRLAGLIGMKAATDPRAPLRRRIQNAVLVRPPLRISTSELARFSRGEWWYPRGALVAQVHDGGRRLAAVSTHLGLDPRVRRRHAAELQALCSALGPPLVLGVDLNEGPDGPAAGPLRHALVDAWERCGSGAGETFPAGQPSLRIDYVLVSAGLSPAACRVPADPATAAASDHLPVVVDVEVP